MVDDAMHIGQPAMANETDVRAYFKIVRRRYVHMLAATIAVFVVVLAVAYLIPPTYRAAATILVESQQIPTDLAQSTVAANAGERLQVIQQRLMTRDNLLQIIRKFGLYPDRQERLSQSEIVDMTRNAIQIQQIDTTGEVRRADAQTIGFTVSFDYSNPTTASRVANELVTLILQQNLQTRSSSASETKSFFEQQVADLEKALGAQEAKIVEFKSVNEGALPETLDYRRGQLTQIQSQLANIAASLDLANDPRTQAAAKEQIDALKRQLETARDQLAAANDERTSLAPLADKGIIPANRIKDLDRRISELQRNVDGLDAQVYVAENQGDRQARIEQLKKQQETLQQQAQALLDGIAKTTSVQIALNALMRDYDNLQTQYNAAKAKMAAAGVGEQMEEDRQAERFEVIEQATAPDLPVKPDRPRIVLAGVFGAIAAGFGVVVLLEMLDRSIRSGGDLERLLQLRPICTIPYVKTIAERRRKKLVVAATLVAIPILLAAAAILVQIYYLPLDLLAERLSQRLGLDAIGEWIVQLPARVRAALGP